MSEEVREVYFANLSEKDKKIANVLLDNMFSSKKLSFKETIEYIRDTCRLSDDKKAIMKAVKEAFLVEIIPLSVLSH